MYVYKGGIKKEHNVDEQCRSISKTQRPSSRTRGLLSPEEREEYLSTIVPRLSQEKIYWRQYVYFEPIPKKNLAIASGATPIGSISRAPDDNGPI
jgi:hypothetical protein